MYLILVYVQHNYNVAIFQAAVLIMKDYCDMNEF